MSIPQLIREARLAQQLDVDALCRKTGVAKNHLLDIEAGKGSSFHTVAYCKRAVMTVAEALQIQQQVEALWRDEDWQAVSMPTRLAGLAEPSSTLLPGAKPDGEPSRRWLPIAGILLLLSAVGIGLHRMDEAEVERPVAKSARPAAPAKEGASPSAEAIGPSSGVASAPQSPDPSQLLRADVERAMQDWARLWSIRSAQDYAGLYSKEFVGVEDHIRIRSQRMAQAKFIQVELTDLSFRETGPGEITVRFRQRYRSDSHQSEDLKELVWRRSPAGIRIWSERLVN